MAAPIRVDADGVVVEGRRSKAGHHRGKSTFHAAPAMLLCMWCVRMVVPWFGWAAEVSGGVGWLSCCGCGG